MIQRLKDWICKKEKALTEKQRLRLMIGLYLVLLLLCGLLIIKTWATLPFVLHP